MFDDRFLKTIANKLVEFFEKHGRRFPWRESRDPYAVMIAEFLLQRTKAETAESPANLTSSPP